MAGLCRFWMPFRQPRPCRPGAGAGGAGDAGQGTPARRPGRPRSGRCWRRWCRRSPRWCAARPPGAAGAGEARARIAARSIMLRPVLAPVVLAIAAVVCSSAARRWPGAGAGGAGEARAWHQNGGQVDRTPAGAGDRRGGAQLGRLVRRPGAGAGGAGEAIACVSGSDLAAVLVAIGPARQHGGGQPGSGGGPASPEPPPAAWCGRPDSEGEHHPAVTVHTLPFQIQIGTFGGV